MKLSVGNVTQNSQDGRRHCLGLNHRHQGIAPSFQCGGRAACRKV